MPIGDGKATEKKVRDVMVKEEESNPLFSFERLYDARAARGKFPPQTSDYHVDFNGKSIYLECKETTSPDRVGIDAFDQFPRMKRKMMAGAHGVLVVYHINERRYRLIDLRDWDLSTRTFKLERYELQRDLSRLIKFMEDL